MLQRDPETGVLRSRHYQVAVLTGPDAGRTVNLDTLLVVGTQPDSSLSLSDPTVSRQHVEFHPLPEGVRVRDLGSRNGTFSGGCASRRPSSRSLQRPGSGGAERAVNRNHVQRLLDRYGLRSERSELAGVRGWLARPG